MMKTRELPPRIRDIPLLPLRDIFVFPHMVVPLFVGRERSVAAIDHAMNTDKLLFLAAQRQARLSAPKEEDIHTAGTLAEITQILRLPDGTVKVLVVGKARGRIERFLRSDPYFACSVELDPEVEPAPPLGEPEMQQALELFERYVEANRRIPREVQQSVKVINTPGRLSDTIASHLALKGTDKQALIETPDPILRLKRLHELMEAEAESLAEERKTRSRTNEKARATRERRVTADSEPEAEQDEFKKELQSSRRSSPASRCRGRRASGPKESSGSSP
jgi:ATP-dependent Lon protease